MKVKANLYHNCTLILKKKSQLNRNNSIEIYDHLIMSHSNTNLHRWLIKEPVLSIQISSCDLNYSLPCQIYFNLDTLHRILIKTDTRTLLLRTLQAQYKIIQFINRQITANKLNVKQLFTMFKSQFCQFWNISKAVHYNTLIISQQNKCHIQIPIYTGDWSRSLYYQFKLAVVI